jgi:hypothetical protein
VPPSKKWLHWRPSWSFKASSRIGLPHRLPTSNVNSRSNSISNDNGRSNSNSSNVSSRNNSSKHPGILTHRFDSSGPSSTKSSSQPLTPTSEWKVQESRYVQRARKRQVREEEVAREREEQRWERERREGGGERVPHARGPPLLVPKVKFPRAKRQIVVVFGPLKKPENMSDKAIAIMALQLVNKDIVDRKDVRTPPFFSTRVTPNNNIVLVAADDIQVMVYENYLGVIANALQRFGKATATLHEKWSKFLVRDVPAWMSYADIRADIESKYPGLKLAQG